MYFYSIVNGIYKPTYKLWLGGTTMCKHQLSIVLCWSMKREGFAGSGRSPCSSSWSRVIHRIESMKKSGLSWKASLKIGFTGNIYRKTLKLMVKKIPVIFPLNQSNNLLVGGIPTPLKNHGLRQVGWWDSQYMGKTCSKPPTSSEFSAYYLSSSH